MALHFAGKTREELAQRTGHSLSVALAHFQTVVDHAAAEAQPFASEAVTKVLMGMHRDCDALRHHDQFAPPAKHPFDKLSKQTRLMLAGVATNCDVVISPSTVQIADWALTFVLDRSGRPIGGSKQSTWGI